VIITGGTQGKQLCWSEPWTGFSARTALPAEFTLVMVTVRGGRYDWSPSHPAGDFGSLAARP
jgi:hypothetical protein